MCIRDRYAVAEFKKSDRIALTRDPAAMGRLGLPIHDTTAGFKCYRREVLETIGLDGIRFKGYAFQIEMKFTAYKCGFKMCIRDSALPSDKYRNPLYGC